MLATVMVIASCSSHLLSGLLSTNQWFYVMSLSNTFLITYWFQFFWWFGCWVDTTLKLDPWRPGQWCRITSLFVEKVSSKRLLREGGLGKDLGSLELRNPLG